MGHLLKRAYRSSRCETCCETCCETAARRRWSLLRDGCETQARPAARIAGGLQALEGFTRVLKAFRRRLEGILNAFDGVSNAF